MLIYSLFLNIILFYLSKSKKKVIKINDVSISLFFLYIKKFKGQNIFFKKINPFKLFQYFFLLNNIIQIDVLLKPFLLLVHILIN